MEIIMETLPLVVMIIIFYAALFIPQRVKRKKHAQFISTLKIGDNVLTDSGIIGRISVVKDNSIILVLKKGEIEINKINIARKL